MHFLQAINSDLSVLIVCNKTGGTIKGDIKKLICFQPVKNPAVFRLKYSPTSSYQTIYYMMTHPKKLFQAQKNKYHICYMAEQIVTSGTVSSVRIYCDHAGLQDCVRRATYTNKTLRKSETQLGEEYKIRFYRKRFSCCRLNSAGPRWVQIFTLTFRHRASSVQHRRFATLHRTLFIYLINKYISSSDICLTLHHWYK